MGNMAYHIAILNFPRKGGVCNESDVSLPGGRRSGPMLNRPGAGPVPDAVQSNQKQKRRMNMKTYKCEEMMCEGCVNRIKKGLDGAGIKNTVDVSVKTVTIDGDKDCEAKAVEILDDLGFSAVEV